MNKWQARADLTWFTNGVLASSTDRTEDYFYWHENTEIRIIYMGKRYP